MEVLDRIMKQVHMTSQNMVAKYNCSICKDTTWIETEKGFKRCECYKKDRVKRLWQSFGVSLEKAKSIKEYHAYDERTKKAKEKAIKYVNDFNNILNSEQNSFALLGQNGAGKTHLIIGIGRELINKGIQVAYMPYVEAIKELKLNAMNEEYYLQLYNRYSKAEVLIIDDLFKDKTKNGELIADITNTDIKHFYPILNYRYNNKLPIIFSSECDPNMLIKLDEAQCGRVIEKCNTLVIFKGNQYNYRLKEFIKK